MSCTTSGVPAPMRLRAIGPPTAPHPMKPTFPAIPSSPGLGWDCSGGRSMSLNGKVALVTGASRGLGEGAARALAQRGAKIMLLARDGDLVRKGASSIGGSAQALACDVSDYPAVERAVAETRRRLGG